MRSNGPDSVEARIAAQPFFEGLDGAFVAEVIRGATEETYETGDMLVRDGEPAKEFLLIDTGKVALEIVATEKPRLTIQTIGPGEVLGWSWLTPPARWRLDARALKTTRAFIIQAEYLRSILDARPADGYRFLLRLVPVIAERLENTQVQLLDIHGL